ISGDNEGAPDQQPEPARHLPWEPVQPGGQERPAAKAEPRPAVTPAAAVHAFAVVAAALAGIGVLAILARHSRRLSHGAGPASVYQGAPGIRAHPADPYSTERNDRCRMSC